MRSRLGTSAAIFGVGELTTVGRAGAAVAVADCGVGNSGVAVGAAGGGVAGSCVDMRVLLVTDDDELRRSLGVVLRGNSAARLTKPVAFTVARSEILGKTDAEAQPASVKIELTDTKNRRACRIVVVIPFCARQANFD